MPWRTFLGWFGLLVAAAVVVAAGVYVVFWPVSDLIATHDVGAITGPTHAAALQSARDAARGRLLTFSAGLFAAGALVYTGRNFTLSRRTFELTEQGQVTDRYTKAIEQLGADKLDVRIGGVYALERVARDSPRDHPTVMEVLAAFIREHSHEQWPDSLVALIRERSGEQLLSADDEPGATTPERGARPDVLAAATVMGRRDPRYDLQAVMLDQANLAHALLTGANLARANLAYTNLSSANLAQADLTRAFLLHANLAVAFLGHANLTSAHLADANLTGAHIGDANLTGANLTRANLTGTWLTGSDLTDAVFTDANLSHANWPADVVVPEGWQRDPDSGRLKRPDINSGGAPTDPAPAT